MPDKKQDKIEEEVKKDEKPIKPVVKNEEDLVKKDIPEPKPEPANVAPVNVEPTPVKENEELVEVLDDDLEKEVEKAMAGVKTRFIEKVGGRKTASARVRLFTQGKKGIIVNDKPYTDYFTTINLQKKVEDPLEKLKCLDKFGVTVIVKGGGPTGQAEAVRHGIAQALVELNPYFKKRLKKSGFLTRDPRMRERKKPGLKRARKAPQWSKR